MPQLDRVAYMPQVFWVVVRFFLLYGAVVTFVVPFFGRVLWTRRLKGSRAAQREAKEERKLDLSRWEGLKAPL